MYEVLYVLFNTKKAKNKFWGEGQQLERPNIKQGIIRNFEISNIKITKDELFNFFNYLFSFEFSNTQNIYNNLSN